MQELDTRIVSFLQKHHVLTLATTANGYPYCANCFYVFDPKLKALIFTSDDSTKHIKDIQSQNLVAGSIVLETEIIGKIRGVQFQGLITQPSGDELKQIKKAYLKRFPVAMLMKTTLWMVSLTFVKFTDNRLGFGKKLHWGEEASLLQKNNNI